MKQQKKKKKKKKNCNGELGANPHYQTKWSRRRRRIVMVYWVQTHITKQNEAEEEEEL
jgi:hypothetical protein